MKYNNEFREKKSQENKLKIIEAAKRLVLDNGYDNVNVSDITNKAGVSKGAFYIHYKTKDDLIQDLIDFTFEEVKKTSEIGNIYDRISTFLIKSMNKIIDEGLKTAQMWFSDTCKASIYGNKKFQYDLKYITEVLLTKMNKESSENLALKIISTYYGIVVSWCISDGNIKPDLLMKDYIAKELYYLLKEVIS